MADRGRAAAAVAEIALSVVRPAQPTMSLELEGGAFVTLRVDRRLAPPPEADKVPSALAGTVAAMTADAPDVEVSRD